MTEYGFLFIAWILVLYIMPFIYVGVLKRINLDLHGSILLMIPTTIIFPILLLYDLNMAPGNNNLVGIPVIIFLPIIPLFLWYIFTESQELTDNFLLSILNIYIPATVSMLILLRIQVLEFSLILPLIFIAPIAAYYFFKHLGYVAACIFFINYLIFDLYGALILLIISAASIILYKSRFRRVERFDDISIEETINTGMPLFTHTGFSEVKNYSKIPGGAIDPYTLDKIHDLIMQGKRIVKCNSCGTYYDREVLNFYGNSCAVFGCSNSQL